MRSVTSNRTSPDHALQRRRSAVTTCASNHHHFSAHQHSPRLLRLSLSLGALGFAKRAVKITLLLILLLHASALARWPIYTPEKLVADFEVDRFYPGPISQTGWTMEASGGRVYHRATLNAQAELLADHGISAFPSAFALLDHKEAYMRYIGAKALQSITGLTPDWFYFQTPDEKAWAVDAKRQWKRWYDAQPK